LKTRPGLNFNYMIQNTQNEQVAKIGNWIATRLEKFEAILLLIFIASFMLKASTDLPVGILIVLTLMTLAAAYFFSAFAMINDEYAGSIESFLHKLASWSCSIAIIGILFTLESWNSSKLFLQIGCFALIFVIPAIIYINSKKTELKFFNSRYILRLVLVCSIGLFFVFASHDLLIKTKIIKIATNEIINHISFA
jgi:hypothetical protein